MTITFFVHGIPQSQGSARAFMAGGRPVITTTNRNLGDWRRLVADQAQPHAYLYEGPVVVTLIFDLPRPKSLSAKKDASHTKRPDLDKLIRAVLDALTGIMWHDDSQVVWITAGKSYQGDFPGHECVGVRITINGDD